MNFTFKNRVFSAFICAIMIIFLMAASIYLSFSQMSRENQWVDHTYEVFGKLQSVMSDLKDVQAAQRGYAITGFEDYLTPYYIAVPRIRESLDQLCVMMSDNPVQSKRCASLKAHALERLEIAEEIIATYKSEGQEKAFALIRGGKGKLEMDEIRIIVADMTSEERTLLVSRRGSFERSSAYTLYAGAAGFLICLVILLIVFRMIQIETRRRTQTEQSLGKTLGDVERLNKDTQMLSRLGDYLRSSRTQDEAYDIIARNMMAIFPETFGAVMIFNNSRNLLKTALTWGSLPESWEKEYDTDVCWALRQGRVHISNVDAKVPACPHLGEGGGLPTVCIPMQAHGDTIGQMVFGFEREIADDRKIDVFKAVAEQISLAMANLNMQRVLREQSIKDPLTKLFNRRYLEETFARELARSQRGEQTMCVIMMDIDHFKKVNDTYGHEAGDAVLATFASMLLQKIRKYDIPCRLGGEEFVIVCPGASLDIGRKKAEEICAAARAMQVKFQNQILTVTVSIGVCGYPEHGETPEELLHKADMCLYKAKQSGRNQVIVFEEGLAEKAPII